MEIGKIIREVRVMAEKLPAPRFWAMWAIAFPAALGYMLSKVPWDKML